MGEAASASAGSSEASADPFVEQLLSRMTPAEKAGQMSQLPIFTVELSEPFLDVVRNGKIGSFLNAQSLEQRNLLQKLAVEESRLGIPLIFGRDVIHGYKTIFPIPLGQAATFAPALVEQAAAAAAREASETGIDWVFAPMVDVSRDARWGRIAESCGEDPYLASAMGAAMVRGFQSTDPASPRKVAACAKHFAGYGAAEAGREYNTTLVPEQLLRDVYLVPFRACVEAGALTLMSGFNDLNGVPATGNELLLRRILKDEWGFQGFVVSDWASIVEMIKHGHAEDEADAARLGAIAGCDMEMASGAYIESLPALVERGAVPGAAVDDAVRRILVVKRRLGLFDRPYAEAPKVSVTLSAGHRALSREIASSSVVLLKNEGGAPADVGKGVRSDRGHRASSRRPARPARMLVFRRRPRRAVVTVAFRAPGAVRGGRRGPLRQGRRRSPGDRPERVRRGRARRGGGGPRPRLRGGACQPERRVPEPGVPRPPGRAERAPRGAREDGQAAGGHVPRGPAAPRRARVRARRGRALRVAPGDDDGPRDRGRVDGRGLAVGEAPGLVPARGRAAAALLQREEHRPPADGSGPGFPGGDAARSRGVRVELPRRRLHAGVPVRLRSVVHDVRVRRRSRSSPAERQGGSVGVGHVSS